MFQLLIAFQDPSQSFQVGSYSSESEALKESQQYYKAAKQMFSVPCIVAPVFMGWN